jgi:hypothetical protein
VLRVLLVSPGAVRTALGGQLPNGATLLARQRVASDHEVVLARWGDEWVTWSVYRDDDRSTSHGHYFQTGDAGWSDLGVRCVEGRGWGRSA